MKTKIEECTLTIYPPVGGFKVGPTTGTYSQKEFGKVFNFIDEHHLLNFCCGHNDMYKPNAYFEFYKIEGRGHIFNFLETYPGDNSIFFTKSQVKEIFKQHPDLFKDNTIYYFPYQGGYYEGIRSFVIEVFPQYEGAFRKMIRKILYKLRLYKNKTSWAFLTTFGELSHSGLKNILVLPCKSPEIFLN